MDKRRLHRFRAALETRRVELRRIIAQLERYGRTPEDEAAADTRDRAGSSHSEDLLMRGIAGERGLLRNVEAALQRIQDGSFGQCVLCEKEINAKRL